MSELIRPKTLLIVEDDPKQLATLEKSYGGGQLGMLTAYACFEADQNPESAYTEEWIKGDSTSPRAKKEIRDNITYKFQEQIKSGIGLVTMARTYSEFNSEMELGVDGVVLDLHIPSFYGPSPREPKPYGLAAGFQLEAAGTPFIVNTAWNHHGPDSQWLFDVICERNWPLVETSEGATKDWKAPLEYIMKEMFNR